MHQNVLYILSFLCFPAIFYSQGTAIKKIDSLLLVSKTPDPNYTAYKDIASILQNASQEEVQSLYDYTIAQDNSDICSIFLYQGYGKNLDRLGLINQSLDLKYKGLKLSQKIRLEESELSLLIGIAASYRMQNKVDSVAHYLNRAEAIAQNKYRGWLWNIFYLRGQLYEELNDLEKAAHYYELMWKSIENGSNNDPKIEGFALWIITDFFIKTEKYPEKQVKFLELLANKYQQSDPDVPSGHIDIRDLFEGEIKSKNINKYKRLAFVSDSLNNISSYFNNTSILTEILSKDGRNSEAIYYLKKLEQRLETVEKPNLKISIYKKLSNSYATTGNYKTALKYQEKQYKLRDSIISSQTRSNVASLEVSYETEKKERKIAEQELTIERTNKQQLKFKIGMIALVSILLLSSLVFTYKIKIQKKLASQKEKLRLKEIIELKQHNKLLALTSMINGQESERLRIAQDLHDSLGGLLSTVKAHFSIIHNEIQKLETLNITEKTNSLIDQACSEVRRISHNMMPHSLSISGLKGAFEDLKEQLISEGFTATFEIENLPKTEDNNRDVMIYRLLQEIISNTRKHAKASSIFLQILSVDNCITILFEDNGQGFDYEKAVKKGGLGLRSINSRIAYLDAAIDWDSRIDQGTSITITIPQ